jgi:hypothetical protein
VAKEARGKIEPWLSKDMKGDTPLVGSRHDIGWSWLVPWLDERGRPPHQPRSTEGFPLQVCIFGCRHLF